MRPTVPPAGQGIHSQRAATQASRIGEQSNEAQIQWVAKVKNRQVGQKGGGPGGQDGQLECSKRHVGVQAVRRRLEGSDASWQAPQGSAYPGRRGRRRGSGASKSSVLEAATFPIRKLLPPCHRHVGAAASGQRVARQEEDEEEGEGAEDEEALVPLGHAVGPQPIALVLGETSHLYVGLGG